MLSFPMIDDGRFHERAERDLVAIMKTASRNNCRPIGPAVEVAIIAIGHAPNNVLPSAEAAFKRVLHCHTIFIDPHQPFSKQRLVSSRAEGMLHLPAQQEPADAIKEQQI